MNQMSVSDYYCTYHHASDVIFDLQDLIAKEYTDELKKELDLWEKD